MKRPLPDQLIHNPDWLVQAIDPRARLARLVRMNCEAYRDASFLDDRMMSPATEFLLCDLDELTALAEHVPASPAGWIFHIGHVGSTLISRLLGEVSGVLALREPRALRDLAATAETERAMLASSLSRLMARRRATDRAVIVKATSFVSEFAQLLVEDGAPALMLYSSPASYIAGILAGENSRRELNAMHEFRSERLEGRGARLSGFDNNDAMRAALAWACEMTSLEAAADALGNAKVLWADFDRTLASLSSSIVEIARHFGLELASRQADELSNGPLTRRYSKALEFEYSPSLRAELLGEARRQHLPQIEEALGELSNAAASFPLLKRALQRAAREK